MPRFTFVLSIATALATALSVPSALQAHDTKSQRYGGDSMMGSGTNMMGQMSQMMDHCSQMMQGASGRPNEQRRDETPPADGRNGKKQ